MEEGRKERGCEWIFKEMWGSEEGDYGILRV